jgi:hypothetical protein
VILRVDVDGLRKGLDGFVILPGCESLVPLGFKLFGGLVGSMD